MHVYLNYLKGIGRGTECVCVDFVNGRNRVTE